MTCVLGNKTLSLERYLHGRYVVFDFETTNFAGGNPLDPRNRCVMVAWKGTACKLQHHYGNVLGATNFWQELHSADFLVAHSAKFEAHWLRRLGLDPTDFLWADTMLFEYVLAGNRHWKLNLGDTAGRYGFQSKDLMIDTLMKCGVCPSDMPKRRLIARCRRDVRTTEQIMLKQRSLLHGSGRLGVALTRCLLTPILAMTEAEGMCLDKARVEETYGEYTKRLAQRAASLDKATGGINPRSPDQRARFLYGTLKFPERRRANGTPIRNKASKSFPDGKPKTDKTTLKWLMTKARSKKQREYIELQRSFSKLNAAVTKNLEFFKGVVDERDKCVFYGQFNQKNTGTHRLSSSGVPQQFTAFPKPKSVQFQNMPIAFKKLFRARDSACVLVDADAPQLEFRVAGFLGDDQQIRTDVDNAADIHKYTASVLNRIPQSKVSDTQRHDAKKDTFKPLYGGSKGTPAQERYYKAFKVKYHDLYETQEGWVDEVGTTGELRTRWGLTFYWKHYLSPYGTLMAHGKSIEPAIFNYPVQALATAEIIPIAFIYLYHRVKSAGLRVRFLNTVHDSVVAEVHKGDLQKYIALVKRAFTTDVYKYLEDVYDLDFDVPLGVEIISGTHWGQGEKVTYGKAKSS